MKKLLSLFLIFSIAVTSFAISSFSFRTKKASEVYITVGSSGQQISLFDLSTIRVKDFENLTGRKLNFFDRIGFKIAQRKLRKSINTDGTINNRKLDKLFEQGDYSQGFHLGGFALGFLLGIIGIIIAYLINDDKKRNRVKWAWIGFAAWILIFLLVIF
jgi:hypothetical protein